MCGWFRYPNSVEHKLIYFYKNVYALNAEEFYVNKRDKEKDDDFDL